MDSVAVKEQYKDGKSYGWAVMAKTQETTANSDGWFWYEVLDDKNIDKLAAIGNNVPGCVSCHAPSQKDMVMIPFPFKQFYMKKAILVIVTIMMAIQFYRPFKNSTEHIK